MSSYLRKLYGLSSAVILAGALAGCATYNKCGVEGCAGDAKVTSGVQTLFNQHPDLGAPGAVGVQTIDHVVYLSGFETHDAVGFVAYTGKYDDRDGGLIAQ